MFRKYAPFILVLVFVLAGCGSKKANKQQVSSFVKKESVKELTPGQSKATELPIILTDINKHYDEAEKADLVTITINNAFIVGNIKVIKDASGAQRVIWPGYKSSKGRFYPTLKFNSVVLKRRFSKAIKKGVAMAYNGETLPFNVTGISIFSYAKGKLKGFVTLTINNKIQLGNMKIMVGKKGLWLAMPSIRTAKGKFNKYVYPIKKGLGKKLSDKVIANYNKLAVGGEE